jgi:hypothetical protein
MKQHFSNDRKSIYQIFSIIISYNIIQLAMDCKVMERCPIMLSIAIGLYNTHTYQIVYKIRERESIKSGDYRRL